MNALSWRLNGDEMNIRRLKAAQEQERRLPTYKPQAIAQSGISSSIPFPRRKRSIQPLVTHTHTRPQSSFVKKLLAWTFAQGILFR
ncbi:hypothetical protein BAUCODRAFT_485093 [Baudoinia panamericana UAMH 10762]|uniref:Uncharacterized protein n=1 Tax=Baudoinia panamericana (strain UAMH 10762) TaxID=717646 RepID=M2MYI7_BAUPA|nr:uncharacterized protein BAUCODRAFT_485093 [Baudoinia panamericana UAMH 10762]EMC96658.1 hypothetical protein BAUCODRAFT_485093 [Baudoinia panamericana UAMH 10762]